MCYTWRVYYNKSLNFYIASYWDIVRQDQQISLPQSNPPQSRVIITQQLQHPLYAPQPQETNPQDSQPPRYLPQETNPQHSQPPQYLPQETNPQHSQPPQHIPQQQEIYPQHSHPPQYLPQQHPQHFHPLQYSSRPPETNPYYPQSQQSRILYSRPPQTQETNLPQPQPPRSRVIIQQPQPPRSRVLYSRPPQTEETNSQQPQPPRSRVLYPRPPQSELQETNHQSRPIYPPPPGTHVHSQEVGAPPRPHARRPKSFMGLSLITMFCSCWLFGLIALIYSCKVNQAWNTYVAIVITLGSVCMGT